MGYRPRYPAVQLNTLKLPHNASLNKNRRQDYSSHPWDSPFGFVAARLHENSFLTNFSNLARAALEPNPTPGHENKKSHLKVTVDSMARPTGFEPVTPAFGVQLLTLS